MRKSNTMQPYKANTLEKACKLERDNISTSRSWILLGGDGDYNHVSIHNQQDGESTGAITLTRGEFRKMAEWYFGVKLPR